MRYILISLGVVLLIIFGIVIFNSGGSKTVKTPTAKTIKLLDYATNTNASVQYTVEGPINSLELHRTIQITITPVDRTVTLFTGYQGQSLGGQTLPNDKNSYREFLEALNRASFLAERKLPNGVTVNAICPAGSRSHFKLVEGSKDLVNRWSASCNKGSFGGNLPLTINLFKSQIPNYGKVITAANAGTNASVSF